MLERHEHRDAAALVDRVKSDVLTALGAGLAMRGRASLIVSGGRTPGALFDTLSADDSIDWSAVTITLADERWVPETHPDSNAGMVRSRLLTGAAAGGRFVPLYGGERSPREGERAATERLAALARPFDLTVLGMGEDGHTASLFPGADGLDRALTAPRGEICVAIDAPGARHPRLTLSLPAILGSRRIALIVTGAAKRAVLEAALGGRDIAKMPVRAILHQQRVPVDVHWSP